MRSGRPWHRDECGFSLIEMVAVLLVVGVLLAIAVPTFVGATAEAGDRQAQANLRTASKAAWAYALEHPEGFKVRGRAVREFDEIEPSLTWVRGGRGSTGPTTISIADDRGQELALAVRSSSGACVYLRLSLVTVESQHADDDVRRCRADDYLDGPNTGW